MITSRLGSGTSVTSHIHASEFGGGPNVGEFRAARGETRKLTGYRSLSLDLDLDTPDSSDYHYNAGSAGDTGAKPVDIRRQSAGSGLMSAETSTTYAYSAES